jgi:acetyl esterase/lipase
MKFLKVTTLIILTSLFSNCKKSSSDSNSTEPIPQRITYTNIVYGTSNAAQKMDIYLPAARAPYPVVVMIHGGGWVIGDKQEYKTSIKTEALLIRGYAVVAINYRLSGVSKFPTQIQDVKAAIRYIRANASTYKLNSNKIGAWGTSAGGHLAALLATSSGVNALEDFTIGDATQSSKIQAAIDWFGPTDFLQMDNQVIAQGCSAGNANHNQANSPESQLMGFAIQTQPLVTQTANPISYVSADDCPIYIQHGNNDCTVPFRQGQILFNALLPLKNSTDVKFDLLTGSGHGTGKFEQIETVNLMIDFLDRYLK